MSNDEINKAILFIGMQVAVILKEGTDGKTFTLYGEVLDQNASGIFLKTSQQISFLNYDTILKIRRRY